MLFSVDSKNGLAIYEQIVRQIKFAVAAETVRPGELIPSVREVARDLAVNPNTVARAYRDLQGDGVLTPVRGTGLEVTLDAPRICRKERLDMITNRLAAVLEEALHSGLDADKVRALVEDQIRKLSKGRN